MSNNQNKLNLSINENHYINPPNSNNYDHFKKTLYKILELIKNYRRMTGWSKARQASCLMFVWRQYFFKGDRYEVTERGKYFPFMQSRGGHSADPEFNKLSVSEGEPYYISLLSKHLYDSIIPDDTAETDLYNSFELRDRYEVPKGQSPLWSSAEITLLMNLFASLLPDSDDYMADYNMSGMPTGFAAEADNQIAQVPLEIDSIQKTEKIKHNKAKF